MVPDRCSLAAVAMTSPKRGEVYLVSFDPTVGSEIQKTRPALILQNDIANRHSPITIVGAITSKFEEPLYPTEVLVKAPEGGLSVDSVILLNQIRSIDRRRLVRRLGAIRAPTMERVDRAIQISLGILKL
jgi:mRNA interferase MazF